jgi:hypothetical protein
MKSMDFFVWQGRSREFERHWTASQCARCKPVPSGISAQIMGHAPSALAEKHYRGRPLDLLRKRHDEIEAWKLKQASINFREEQPRLRAV